MNNHPHRRSVHGIEPVRLLHGHVDAGSAYLVEDYPYGRVLRCRIRYWIETATIGGAKIRWQRFVSQTSNPKRPGHPWNNPQQSTYSLRTWMYLDAAGHVQHTGISGYGIDPHEDARLRLIGIYEQMTDSDRDIYDRLLAASHEYSDQWDRWEDIVAFLIEHLSRHGEPPRADNGFVRRDGDPFYIGEQAYPIAVAMARQRLAS